MAKNTEGKSESWDPSWNWVLWAGGGLVLGASIGAIWGIWGIPIGMIFGIALGAAVGFMVSGFSSRSANDPAADAGVDGVPDAGDRSG